MIRVEPIEVVSVTVADEADTAVRRSACGYACYTPTN